MSKIYIYHHNDHDGIVAAGILYNTLLNEEIGDFEVIFNMWNVWKNKVQIVLNNITSSGIDDEVFTEVSKLKVIGNIKQNQYENEEAYEKILETLEYVPKKTLIEKINNSKKMISNMIKIRQYN